MKKSKIIIVIPSYEPRHKLCEIVNELIDVGLDNIIVVNDGSSSYYDEVFDKIDKHCVILKHLENKGKGEALKTAFKYITNDDELKNCDGVITMDCDGQHSVKDVKKIANILIKEDKIILGCRCFDDSDVPYKSRIGNKITSMLMKLSGLHINDTQTGLRAIPLGYLYQIIEIKGSKFDYEMNMLLYFYQHKISMEQIPIATLYYNENKGTHYKPIKDSLLICKSLLRSELCKYIIVSIVSFIIDLTVFNIFIVLMKGNYSFYIIFANVIARTISLIINFILNKYYVFENRNNGNKQFLKYISLCLFSIMISSSVIQIVCSIFDFNEVIVKIIVDTILFMMNYMIQRKRVFL